MDYEVRNYFSLHFLRFHPSRNISNESYTSLGIVTGWIALYWIIINVVTFEVFTAMTMKNGVFWDINLSSYLAWNTLGLRHRAQPVNAMLDLRFSWR
jgi:hypothetical protein